MVELARIKPPGRSYADWRRFLEDCRQAGVAAILADSRGQSTGDFATPLGYALLRRWRWLQEAEERGLRYEDAERAFDAAIERDRDALAASMREQEHRRAKAVRERESARRRKGGDDSDELLSHATEVGL
jgi:hypothetical protein